MGRNRKSSRGVGAFTPLDVPLSKIRYRNPLRVPIRKGVPIAVHHVTTAEPLKEIISSGRMRPRKRPNFVPLFGYGDGGYFAFEQDTKAVRHWKSVFRSNNVISATITPQNPLVVHDVFEPMGTTYGVGLAGLGYDQLWSTRIAYVDAVLAALPESQREGLMALRSDAIKRKQKNLIEIARFRLIESGLPSYMANTQFAELRNADVAISNNLMEAVNATVRNLGYDVIAILPPANRVEPDSDQTGGAQILALTPDVVTINGIRA